MKERQWATKERPQDHRAQSAEPAHGDREAERRASHHTSACHCLLDSPESRLAGLEAGLSSDVSFITHRDWPPRPDRAGSAEKEDGGGQGETGPGLRRLSAHRAPVNTGVSARRCDVT